MKKILTLLAATAICGSSSFADLVNITVYDGEGSGTGWYGAQEDQEVSNYCMTGQKWDLEAFLLDGSLLSLVGGYDFINGEDDPYYPNYQPRLETYYGGDIFIDVTGDAKYGSALTQSFNENREVSNTGGWDYVLDLDVDNLTYKIYEIDASTKVLTSFFAINADANPWLYSSGGDLIGSGVIGYKSGLADAQTGFAGGWHNMMTVDLSFLGNKNFTAHYTMQCGNDNIIGKGTVDVPEPASFALIGSGLLFLSFFLKRRKRA